MAEIGFGKAGQGRKAARLLRKDGSFNVRKLGFSPSESLSIYHALMTMSWPCFFALMVSIYLISNVLFAMLFLLCGEGALSGLAGGDLGRGFAHSFFFSVQTFATIGYGGITPVSLAANILVTVESLVGLLEFALITGLLFARFSRPQVRVAFSRQALIAPFQNGLSLQFRMINQGKNELLEPRVNVMYAWLALRHGQEIRDYQALELYLERVLFMPLYWTVTHPIGENSPLRDLSKEELGAVEAEFLVLFSAIDEASGERVHLRHSYRWDELRFNAKFDSLYIDGGDGVPTIDVTKISAATNLTGSGQAGE